MKALNVNEFNQREVTSIYIYKIYTKNLNPMFQEDKVANSFEDVPVHGK